MRKALILLLLFSLALLSPYYYAYDSPFKAIGQWLTKYVAPGEKMVPLEVTLVYQGSYELTDVEVMPVKEGPFLVSPKENYTISSMYPGVNYTLVFIGNITPNIPLGIYTFHLELTYRCPNGLLETSEVKVEIPILGYVELSAEAEVNGTVFPGDHNVPVLLTIYNTGTVTATNVTLLFNSTYPLKFVTNSVNVPVIPAGGYATSEVLVDVYSNATVGVYKIPFEAVIFGDEKASLSMEFVINDNQTVSGEVMSTFIPESVGPYELDVPIQLEMLYLGPVPVSSYVIEAYLPKGFTNVTGGNVVYVRGGPLAPDTPFTVTLTVNILNATLGVYTIPLKITWYAIEGEGSVVGVVQYTSFTLALDGSVSLYVGLSSYVLSPGSLNSVYLIVTNNGTGPVYNLSLSISTDLSVIGKIPEIPYLGPGKSVKIPIELFVPASFEDSSVQLLVTARYLDSALEEETYQQSIGVYVGAMTGPSNPIIVDFVPNILSTGTFTPSTLVLINTLNVSFYNISVELSSPIYVNSSTFNVVELPAKSKVSIPVILYSQSPGSFPITISLSYYENGVSRSEQLTVTVYVMQSSIPNAPVLIRFNTTALNTGQLELTYLVITNVLTLPLYNVTVKLAPQAGMYINSTTFNIPLLKPKESMYIPVEAYTQSSGVLGLTAFITYYQSGIEKQFEETLDLLATGSIDIVITGVTSIPSVASSGGLVSITATVYNFGTGTAKGVTVTVYPPKGITVIGEDTYYIGNIQPDTSSTFTFAFKVSNATKPGVYTIPVVFTFMNDIGEVLHSKANISITVSSKNVFAPVTSTSSSGTTIDLIIIGVIVVIGIVLILFVLRRGKSK